MSSIFLSILLLAVGVCAFVAAAEINPRCAPHEDIEDRCNFGMKRFYFNGTQCVEFTYGGCANLANKYVTQKSCEKTCMPDSGSSLKVKPDVPAGNSKNVNSTTKVPVNKFDDSRCVPVENIKQVCPGPLEMYHFNGKNCIKFSYGGCGGIANVYQTRADCKKSCMLDTSCVPHAGETGRCRAAKSRYFFNGTQCVKYTYGGCGGNDNRYRTQEECQNKCMPDSQTEAGSNLAPVNAAINDAQNVNAGSEKTDPRCSPVGDLTGRCNAAITRFYFDGTQCKDFTYGGCGGTANNYLTQAECQATCMPHVTTPRSNKRTGTGNKKTFFPM